MFYIIYLLLLLFIYSEAGDPGWFLERSDPQEGSLHLSAVGGFEEAAGAVGGAAWGQESWTGRDQSKWLHLFLVWPCRGVYPGRRYCNRDSTSPGSGRHSLCQREVESRTGFEDVVGRHGRGNRFSHNGFRLREFTRVQSLRIAGTWYQRLV